MKRFRVLAYDFDTRATLLALEPGPDWTQEAIAENERRKAQVIKGLRFDFGERGLEQKVDNFKAIGPLPISLIAFHNRFFRQARAAFVCECYYPALTSVCALGERVLNHLILRLRDYYRSSPEYKRIYRKDSFDDWNVAIDTLEAWDVLLPKAVEAFRQLRDDRNAAIHFDPETDRNDRAFALEAIIRFNTIVTEQFSAFGTQPWYIEGTLGAIFVKKDFEQVPFVKEVVLPNCHLVGHLHLLEMRDGQWVVKDEHVYENRAVNDEEFKDLYNNRRM